MKKINILLAVVILLLGNLSCKKEQDIVFVPVPEVPNRTLKIIELEMDGEEVIVVGSFNFRFAVAFKNDLNGKRIIPRLSDKNLPALFEDDDGNIYNVFGEITQGPDAKQHLAKAESVSGYWFAISNFFPGLKIYENENTFSPVEIPLTDPEWSIPKELVISGAGKDAIPAIDNPRYLFANQISETENIGVEESDLALVASVDGERFIFPIPILNYHEIVNDEINGTNFTLMYCPLTGTANLWSRELDDKTLKFGVSGLLYNNNLLAFDRNTQSHWNQITGECVNGRLRGAKAKTEPIIETTFGLAQSLVPDAKILSIDTGFDRNYQSYPYGDYRENHGLILGPNANEDDRLPNKTKVFSVKVGDSIIAFSFDDFN